MTEAVIVVKAMKGWNFK